MKAKAGVGERLAQRFDVPQEAMSGMPRLTISGCTRVLVENHRGLLEYSGELVRIDGGRVQVKIRGDRLELECMDKSEIVITGQIFSAELE